MILQNTSQLMAGIVVSMGMLLPSPQLERHEGPEKSLVRNYLNKPTAFPDVFYETFDWATFEQWTQVNQSIKYTDIDYNLLNAAIFHYTNKYRVQSR